MLERGENFNGPRILHHNPGEGRPLVPPPPEFGRSLEDKGASLLSQKELERRAARIASRQRGQEIMAREAQVMAGELKEMARLRQEIAGDDFSGTGEDDARTYEMSRERVGRSLNKEQQRYMKGASSDVDDNQQTLIGDAPFSLEGMNETPHVEKYPEHLVPVYKPKKGFFGKVLGFFRR